MSLLTEKTNNDLLAGFDENAFEWLREKTAPFTRLMAYYRCAMMEIETKFKVLNEQYSLEHDRNPISSIRTRLKSPLSIKGKLEKRGIDFTLENLEKNIHDIAGVRVICAFIEDVYALVDALTKQDDVRLIETKDYIKNPKPNGYRSLHMIVEIPIFLRDEKKYIKKKIVLK